MLVLPVKKKVHNVDHRCMHLFIYMHLKEVGISFTLCSSCCIKKAPGAVFRYSFVMARCMLQKGKKVASNVLTCISLEYGSSN